MRCSILRLRDLHCRPRFMLVVCCPALQTPGKSLRPGPNRSHFPNQETSRDIIEGASNPCARVQVEFAVICRRLGTRLEDRILECSTVTFALMILLVSI